MLEVLNRKGMDPLNREPAQVVHGCRQLVL